MRAVPNLRTRTAASRQRWWNWGQDGVPWDVFGRILLERVEQLSQLKGSRGGGQVIVEGTAEEMHEYTRVQQGVLDLFYRKQRNEPGAEELWSVVVSAVTKRAAAAPPSDNAPARGAKTAP